MNERVRQLADKIWAEEYWDNPSTDKLLPAQLNRFAELIVKECAYLVNHQQRTTGYTTHVKMLCHEFGIEYNEQEYFGDR